MIQLVVQSLISPPVLFFLVGLASSRLPQDFSIPRSAGRLLSLYLVAAIGIKGGAQLAEQTLTREFVLIASVGIASSFLLPVVGFWALSFFCRLSLIDRIAVSAHYGSVSLVTFAAATGMLERQGVAFEGYWVAILALMEAPAIITALFLKQIYLGGGGRSLQFADFKPVFFCTSTILLYGSLLVGFFATSSDLQELNHFFAWPFVGLLCLFLFDLGSQVGRKLKEFRGYGIGLSIFGVLFPLVNGVLGVLIASLMGLSVGGGTLLAVLLASASYIVVPAAMRVSFPEAKPVIYVSLALGITFPFNILLGIPFYYALMRLASSYFGQV